MYTLDGSEILVILTEYIYHKSDQNIVHINNSSETFCFQLIANDWFVSFFLHERYRGGKNETQDTPMFAAEFKQMNILIVKTLSIFIAFSLIVKNKVNPFFKSEY